MKVTQSMLVTLFVVTCSLTGLAQRQTDVPSPPNPQWQSGACILPRTFYEQTSSSYSKFTRDKALQLRKSLDTAWLSKLPCCPERIPGGQNEIFEESLSFASCFHLGAERGFRTSRLFHTLEAMTSGQQCNYDGTGNLITSGPGAGTPDFYSPNAGPGGEERHWEFDVFPWTQLTPAEYNSVWTINQGCQSSITYSVDPRNINNVWLYVEQGELIIVNASGSIVLDVDRRRSGPEGQRFSPRTETRSIPFPSAPRGALLGGVYTGSFKLIKEISIDKENLFFVGKGGDFTMPASGYLVFLVNDGLLANNSGKFQVTFYRKVSHRI